MVVILQCQLRWKSELKQEPGIDPKTGSDGAEAMLPSPAEPVKAEGSGERR